MKLTEGGRLERPNICWICSRTPEVGSAVIDTEKVFDGYPYNLNGRMYVCETCATQIAGFFDLVSKDAVEIAQNEQKRAEGVVRGVKQRLDTLIFELKGLAENPSALTEVTDGPEATVGRGRVGTEEDKRSGVVRTVDGASADKALEGGDEAASGDDSGAEGRHRSSASAQPRTRKRASSAA